MRESSEKGTPALARRRAASALMEIAVVVLLATTGCAPARVVDPSTPMSALDAAATSAAAGAAREYAGVRYVGSSASPDSAEPRVLYFTTQQTRPAAVAHVAAVLGRQLSQTSSETVSTGFELVVVGESGFHAVRVAFDTAALRDADWGKMQEFAGDPDEYVLFFRAASSYEWGDRLDWRSLLAEGYPENRDEFPNAAQFPQAKFDEAAIRGLAAAISDSWSFPGGPTIRGSATAVGSASSRHLTFQFTTDLAELGVGSAVQAASDGSMAIPRLAADPTVASVEIVLAENDNEILRVRYDRPEMNGVDWERMRLASTGARGSADFLTSSTSYRWADWTAWKDFVFFLPESAKGFPISK
jgi:hypothetical protein